MTKYSSKILVAVGCSHTYGDYLNQHDDYHNECHSRSWVKKLEKIAKFSSSLNLSFGGSSNMRSFRVIKEHVLSSPKEELKNKVIMFGLTEPLRFELPSLNWVNLNDDRSFAGNYYMNMFVPFQINTKKSNSLQNFINTQFGVFTVDEHSRSQLVLDIISMHLFLKNFNIEHYFLCFLINKPYLGDMKSFDLPVIDFEGHAAISFAKMKGFKVGRDVDPRYDCNHLDHDGNEFLAKYILNRITEYNNDN
jgi:hypothetical protein